jgi:hypothetical protein
MREKKKAKYFYYTYSHNNHKRAATTTVEWRRKRINILANLRCSMRIYPVIQKTINQLCGFFLFTSFAFRKYLKSSQKAKYIKKSRQKFTIFVSFIQMGKKSLLIPSPAQAHHSFYYPSDSIKIVSSSIMRFTRKLVNMTQNDKIM